MTEADWIELGKLIELVRTHKVKTLETKVGGLNVHIYYRGLTTHVEIKERAVHA